MKETIRNINALQSQITELNKSAFNQLCTIINDVCSAENNGVQKLSKGCFIVNSSVFYSNDPWSVEYQISEITGKVLINEVTKVFAKRERISDVLDYLNTLVSKAVGNTISIVINRSNFHGITNYSVFKKSLVMKIIDLAKL